MSWDEMDLPRWLIAGIAVVMPMSIALIVALALPGGRL